ncbi:hypothetical protein [Pontibacter vulgaris]|uniref:hypothetical protein n=1 Tax=Pontibacter vulgaris TaxID=2905679 RepID=UPI001FA8049B|nr:hypothetical protein [Pontibacter vulgaris]
MRKYTLNIPSFTLHLIFGSLLLGVIRIMLSVYDIVETGSLLSSIIKYVSGAMLLAGIILRLYEAKHLGSFNSLMIRLAIGAAIVIVMLLTNLMHTPTFLKDLF